MSGETRDKLETLFGLQRSLDGIMPGLRGSDTRDGRVSELSMALIHEVVELRELTNWKWWKAPVPFDEPAAREELIDVLHFTIQIAMELGMTPEDVVAEYSRKHDINVRRQREGY